jgi:hypothetical protein
MIGCVEIFNERDSEEVKKLYRIVRAFGGRAE